VLRLTALVVAHTRGLRPRRLRVCRGCGARRQPQARRALLQPRLLLPQWNRLPIDGRWHDRRHRGGTKDVRRVEPVDLLYRSLHQHACAGRRNRRDSGSRIAATLSSASPRGAERAGPPATFAEAYALARRAGLHRTAPLLRGQPDPHEAPPTNYLICRTCSVRSHRPRLQHAGLGLRVAEARAMGCISRPAPGPAWCTTAASPQRIRRMVEPTESSPSTPTIRPCSRPTSPTLHDLVRFDRWGPTWRAVQPRVGRGLVARRTRQERLRIAFRREIAELDTEFGYETTAPAV